MYICMHLLYGEGLDLLWACCQECDEECEESLLEVCCKGQRGAWQGFPLQKVSCVFCGSILNNNPFSLFEM